MNVVRLHSHLGRLTRCLVRPAGGQYQVTALSCTPWLQYRRYSAAAEDHIQSSPYGTVDIPKVALHEYIWGESHLWEHKTAVQCGITGRQYTYAQMRKLCSTFAASMQNRFGLKKGDCIALMLPNMPEYAVIFLGGSQAGLVATTLNSLYGPDEIAKQLRDSNAKLVLTDPERYANVVAGMKLAEKDLPVVLVGGSNADAAPGTVLLADMLDPSSCGQLRRVDVTPEDSVAMPYSSGTTGLPKGVELTHHNIVANVEQMKHPQVRMLLHTTETVQDVVLGLLPMYHIYGMVIVLLTTLHGGGKLVTLPKFDPTLFIDTIVKYEVGLLYLVPPLVVFLSSHPAVLPQHLSSVRCVMSGAAPCGEKDANALLAKKPTLNFQQGYGMTEASPCVLNTFKARLSKYASTGVPLPSTRCKIVDIETRQALPTGEVGELLVQGPQVMKGYFNKPEANKDIFQNGWLCTGDLGYYDEDGDFYIVDRIKELIKVKGLQVAPAELEELLRSHSKILEAAVIGMPDARSGELPRAFVVLRPGQSATEDEIQKFVASKVTKHKHLDGGVTFLDAIPKSAAGKILRKELRAKYSPQS